MPIGTYIIIAVISLFAASAFTLLISPPSQTTPINTNIVDLITHESPKPSNIPTTTSATQFIMGVINKFPWRSVLQALNDGIYDIAKALNDLVILPVLNWIARFFDPTVRFGNIVGMGIVALLFILLFISQWNMLWELIHDMGFYFAIIVVAIIVIGVMLSFLHVI